MSACCERVCCQARLTEQETLPRVEHVQACEEVVLVEFLAQPAELLLRHVVLWGGGGHRSRSHSELGFCAIGRVIESVVCGVVLW